MMTSKLGKLRDKFNNSNMDGKSPSITTEELQTLLDLICDQVLISIEIEDKPLVFYWKRERDSVERVLENRLNKSGATDAIYFVSDARL